jgi:hypothetical protein
MAGLANGKIYPKNNKLNPIFPYKKVKATE